MLLLAVIFCALFISESRLDQEFTQHASKKVDRREVKDYSVCKQPPLHYAVSLLHVTDVLKILEEGVEDIHTTDCDRLSAMHLAIRRQEESMVLALLEKKFNLNRLFEGVGTVLEYAIKNSVDMARYIIGLGANINQKFDPNGETYLHRAIRNGDFSFTKILVQLGANLEAKDWEYNSPLILSVKENQIAIFNFLAASGADISKGNLLHLAVKKNITDWVRIILDRGHDVDSSDENGDTPIVLALRNDNTAIADILANFKADISQQNNEKTLFELAFEKRSYAFMEFLLRRGFEINGKIGRSVMYEAVKRDEVEAVEFFASFGANVTSWNLHQFIYGGKYLVQIAVESGSDKTLKLLLERGVKLKYNTRPIWEPAIDRDDVGVLDILNGFGVSLNAVKYGAGGNLLHLAADKGKAQSIRWLAQHGVNINGTGTFSKRLYVPVSALTPLHLAVIKNHLSAVRALVESGSCLECKDGEGETPLYIAKITGKTEIADYLEKQISHG